MEEQFKEIEGFLDDKGPNEEERSFKKVSAFCLPNSPLFFVCSLASAFFGAV